MSRLRLQKIIAQAGLASRRKAEELILSGRVRINGQVVTELGVQADPEVDKIELDGKTISAEESITVLMNKPRGVVSTANDPEGRETVVDIVRRFKVRLFPVGRLDYSTSGALLLTNDGELAHALTHPKAGAPKVYQVKIKGHVPESTLESWRSGVDLDGTVTRAANVFRLEENQNFTWLEVVLRQGLNRQIHKMAEAFALSVVKLKRVSFAGLTIEGLSPGQFRKLTPKELHRLHRDYVAPLRRVGKKKSN